MGDDPRIESIVRAASEVVQEDGHEDLDVGKIAWRAGVSTQVILELFPSRDDLFVAVLERRDIDDIETVRTLLQERGTCAASAAREALHELVARNTRQPRLLILYHDLATASVHADHPAAAYFRRRYRESQDILADMVTGLTREPSVLGREILAIMDGLQLQWLRDPKAFDLVEAWEHAADALFGS